MVVQVVVPLVHKVCPGLVLCETTGHRWWLVLVLGCAVLCCNLDMGHHHTEPGHHWHSDRRYGALVVGQHTALYHCNDEKIYLASLLATTCQGRSILSLQNRWKLLLVIPRYGSAWSVVALYPHSVQVQ